MKNEIWIEAAQFVCIILLLIMVWINRKDK